MNAALVQLFTISTSSLSGPPHGVRVLARPLGATTVVVAFCVLCVGEFGIPFRLIPPPLTHALFFLLGFTRYFSIQSALTKGLFPAARWTVAGITMVLGALVSIVFALSLHGRRTIQV